MYSISHGLMLFTPSLMSICCGLHLSGVYAMDSISHEYMMLTSDEEEGETKIYNWCQCQTPYVMSKCCGFHIL